VAAVLAVAVPERRHQSRLFNLDVLEEPDGGRIGEDALDTCKRRPTASMTAMRPV
jgi:hypothetical protein